MKIFIVLITALTISFNISAQVPQKMSYQMVVRNSTNAIVANQTVAVRLSILRGSATGTVAFAESHNISTNVNGLASLVIGEGIVLTGSFAQIDWSNGPYFIQTEVDPTGASNYSITATNQLMSVPYALYAGAVNGQGKTYLIISGNLTNEQAAAKIAADAGRSTQFVWIQFSRTLTSVNLSGINNLVELVIQNNENLQSVIMPGLTSVDSKVVISNNKVLTTVSLPDLANVSGNVLLQSNPTISNLSFPKLADIGSDLIISSNQNMGSFSLPSLTSVFGDVRIAGNTSVSLLNFSALTNARKFRVYDNLFLTALSTPRLSVVEDSLGITGNVGISSLLLPLLHATGNLDISSNPQLMSISIASNGGTGVSRASNVTINNNDNLNTITNSGLSSIAGNFNINSNPLLSSITFPSLTYVGQDVSIQGNSIDATMSLSALINVGRDATLSRGTLVMPQFKKVRNLTVTNMKSVNITALDTVGWLRINANTFTSLALPNLNVVQATLEITGNAQMTSISFPNLSIIGPSNATTSNIFLNNSLSSSQVNGILNKLVNIIPPLSSKYISVNQNPSAPPTGQGLVDKATLQSRGNTVITN